MLFKNPSSISWQTNELTFKNKSIPEIKALLASQYGAEIQLYNELFKFHQASSLNENEEIRMVLYIQYEPGSDQLMVRGMVR